MTNKKILDTLLEIQRLTSEIYKESMADLLLCIINTEEDLEMYIQLSTNTEVLFKRFLQAVSDVKMYSSPLVSPSSKREVQ